MLRAVYVGSLDWLSDTLMSNYGVYSPKGENMFLKDN